jgi:HTH-type transcriptional regulator/antitoxin HigA
LIPASYWSVAEMATPAAVIALAQRLFISPCIIAGRVWHKTGEHTMFNRQFRDKVKAALGMY